MAYRSDGACHQNGLTPSSRTIVGRDRLNWRKEGTTFYLYHRSNGKPLVSIEADANYPDMLRVRKPSGKLSDFMNLSRAKDAAASYALLRLNSNTQESPYKTISEHHKPAPIVQDTRKEPSIHGAPNGSLAGAGRE